MRLAQAAVSDRIRRVLSEIRKLERECEFLKGERSRPGSDPFSGARKEQALIRAEARIQKLIEEREYWLEVQAEQIESSGVITWNQGKVKKGDYVEVWGSWYRVSRVSSQWVGLSSYPGSVDRVPWAEVRDHWGQSEESAL